MSVRIESSSSLAAVPSRCRARMQPQPLEVWTPLSLVGSAMLVLLSVLSLPRQATLMPVRTTNQNRA